MEDSIEIKILKDECAMSLENCENGEECNEEIAAFRDRCASVVYRCEICEKLFTDMDGFMQHNCDSTPCYIEAETVSSLEEATHTETQVDENHKKKPDDLSGNQWSYEDTLHLIDFYRQNIVLLKSPNVRKNQVWQIISQNLSEKGYIHSYQDCDNKMRNLKYRYRILANENKKNPNKRKWEFYDIMHGLMEGNSCTTPIITDSTRPLEAYGPHFFKKKKDGKRLRGDTATHWSHEATVCLLESYKEMFLFLPPCVKKNKVWQQIAAKLTTKGFNYTYHDCDCKMRQLKYRYRVIRSGSKESSASHPKWEYFDILDELAKTDASLLPLDKSSTCVAKKLVKTALSTTKKKPRPVRLPSLSSVQEDSAQTLYSEFNNEEGAQAPAWFSAFATQFNQQMQYLTDLQKESIVLAKEQNELLKKLLFKHS